MAQKEDGGESRHQMLSVLPSDAPHSSWCMLSTFRLFFCFSPPRFNPISNKLKSQPVSELAFLKNNRFKKAARYICFLMDLGIKEGGKGKRGVLFL